MQRTQIFDAKSWSLCGINYWPEEVGVGRIEAVRTMNLSIESSALWSEVKAWGRKNYM